jgi:hypothetical protein
MDATYLTLALAKSISRQNPPSDEWPDFLDLSKYEKADPAAIRFLSGQGQRGCISIGLTEIDVETATIIANWSTTVHLTKLTRMTPEVAAILAAIRNLLAFEGLAEMNVDVAVALAKSDSSLHITLLEKLSPEVAAVLSRHKFELHITVAKPPPMEAQRVLLYQYAGYQVTLKFPVEKEMSDDLQYMSNTVNQQCSFARQS